MKAYLFALIAVVQFGCAEQPPVVPDQPSHAALLESEGNNFREKMNAAFKVRGNKGDDIYRKALENEMGY